MAARIPLISQIKDNFLSILSLFIAIAALLYSTYRSELTERNFNLRPASYEILKNLGELQVIVNYASFQPEKPSGDPMMGWGRIALISDLSQLLPAPVPETTAKLVDTWKNNWSSINTDEKSSDEITAEIDASRAAILQVLRSLN